MILKGRVIVVKILFKFYYFIFSYKLFGNNVNCQYVIFYLQYLGFKNYFVKMI